MGEDVLLGLISRGGVCDASLGAMAIFRLVGVAISKELVYRTLRISDRINQGRLQGKVTAFADVNDGGKPLAGLLRRRVNQVGVLKRMQCCIPYLNTALRKDLRALEKVSCQ
jgi:hypothetical protein